MMEAFLKGKVSGERYRTTCKSLRSVQAVSASKIFDTGVVDRISNGFSPLEETWLEYVGRGALCQAASPESEVLKKCGAGNN